MGGYIVVGVICLFIGAFLGCLVMSLMVVSKDNPDPDTRVWKESQITYTDGLKKGDLVAVQKLDGNNMYVILARVVSA